MPDIPDDYLPDEPEVERARCRRCGYYQPHLTIEDLCGGCHDATYPPPPRPEDPTHD